MARSAEIPTFQAPAPEYNPDRAYAQADAFAAPGEAARRLGGAIARIGEGVEQIAAARAQQYGLDHWAEAMTQWQEEYQNGVEEARQSGQYQGFARRLRERMDADLQTRVDGAPDGMVAARLRRRFAVLGNQIAARAASFEHGMEIQDAQARLGTGLESLAKTVYRDPSLAAENYAFGKTLIDEAAGLGNLDPAQRRKVAREFGNTLWSAAINRGLEQTPFQTAGEIERGVFDDFLDLPTLERLRARGRPALADAAAERAIAGSTGGGPLAPPPPADATDAEIDIPLMAIIRRESGGNPNIGYGGVDVSGAPRDETGFPLWAGRMGPRGISHAAGLFQFQPDTWRPVAKRLGIADFSEASQWRVAREVYRREGERPWAASAGGGASLARMDASIDAMALAPDVAADAKARVRLRYNARETDALAQQRMAERAAKEAVRQAEDAVIADAFSDEPKITAQQIARDPRFAGDPAARLRMINLVQTRARAPAVDPAAAAQTVRRLTAEIAAGTISDPGPILDEYNKGNLTEAQFNFASKRLEDVRTDDGLRYSQAAERLIRGVGPMIDKSNPLAGRIDQSGKLMHEAFAFDLYQALAELRRRNAPRAEIAELLNPRTYVEHPERLTPYTKTMQEAVRDLAPKMQTGVPPARPVPPSLLAPPAAPVASAPIPPAPAGAPAPFVPRIIPLDDEPAAPVTSAPVPRAAVPGVLPRLPGESLFDYEKRSGGVGPGR